MMGEKITINPTWRNSPPFEIYRNPDSRDRRDIFSRGSHIVRFTLTGDGSLFIGDAYEFMHYDSHTTLCDMYRANPYWDGLLYGNNAAPLSNPNYLYYHEANSFSHTTNEFNSEKTALLMRTSNFHYRERGLLDQSIPWKRFTVGMGLDFPKILPLPGQTSNQIVTASTRAFIILHGDGHLYFFDPEMSENNLHLDAERILQTEERTLVSAPGWDRGTQCVIGFRLGGNNNLHYVFSEVSDPRSFLLQNENFIKCFGQDFNFEISEDSIRMHKLKNR
jgi:hypothetical protein